MKRLLLLILLLTLPSTFAVVDLLAPEDILVTNAQSIDFDYYASIDGFQSCALYIDEQAFPDIDAESNAMNSVQVQNIASGTYSWNITCIGSEVEGSEERTLTIDLEAPTLAVVLPQENDVTDMLVVDIIPNDNIDNLLTCTISWLNNIIDTVDVTPNTHFVQTYSAQPGTGDLSITCEDDATNTVTETRTVSLEPQLFLTLTTDATEYGIDDPVQLTIDTLPDANVIVDVCPDTEGFVQCTTALLDTSSFPQTITLPFMNKTGPYIIDGIATYNASTVTAQVTYDITNTLDIDVRTENKGLNTTITLTATVGGGAPPYRISWLLSNNTVRTDVSSVDVVYDEPGEYNITITAEDASQNTREIIKTITIDPEYDITFIVVDNETQTPVTGATVDFAGVEWTTLQDGLAFFTITEGRHRLFLSATGYQYVVEEYTINKSRTITIPLAQVSGNPVVTITNPAANGTSGLPTSITFAVQHTEPLTCTLLKSTDTNWFIENGTLSVNDGKEKNFVRDYPLGRHTIRVECLDAVGRAGSSALLTFTVKNEQTNVTVEEETPIITTDGELYLQQLKEDVERSVATLDTYEKDEQQTIELIEFDANLKRLKRTIQQSIRDVDDLRFRSDITEEQRVIEREQAVQRARDAIATTPVSIVVRDSKQYSKYVEEEHLESIFAAMEELSAYNLDKKQILEDQQLFTITSRIVHTQFGYYDGRVEDVTVVARTFTYASDMEERYSILEIIPKNAAKDASILTFVTDGEVLLADPVVRFSAEEKLVYTIPGEISFHKLEEIHTMLVGAQEVAENSITGFAILSGTNVKILGWPLILSVVLIVLIFLLRRFNIFEQLKFISYKFGKHEQVHFVRVLVNDADDQLIAENYEKAELIYKEVRMTYDTLPDIEKNDLYEDVMGLVQKMDSYYFNMVMIELDEHLKAGDVEAAITSYEKLLGTYERLQPEEQQKLVDTVTSMAKRVGVGA